MAAVTRWVLYPASAEGSTSVGGATVSGVGTRAFVRGNTPPSPGDKFSIGTTTNRLYVNLDGDGGPTTYVTLASGTDLDPRFVAKDVTEKLHALGLVGGYPYSQCVWEDGKLKVYSGSLGSGASASVVSGTNTAHLQLGFGSKTETGGGTITNQYGGGVVVSGTYSGLFDDMYHIIMNKEVQVGTPSKGGTNSYTGTITAGGIFTYASNLTYSIEIDVTNGTTMGAGSGNVPTMTWDSTGAADDSAASVELLYPNYWYNVGTKGLKVKFTDAVFNTCANPNYAWTIACTYAQYVQGSNTQAPAGTAMYVWGSTRGDDASAAVATVLNGYTRLGSRGLYIKFDGSGNFLAGDEYRVMCKPPQPASYNITNLNFGNVTVSTNSTIKPVIFEMMSGGVEISTVKFGLQSHGSFSHHDAGNLDTKFHFGTVGPGNNAGSNPTDGLEWRTNVVAADISSDVPPSYLYATKDDLAVVADADTSEVLGVSTYAGMVADPIFLAIQLGANEVGANSTVNFRCFFDYS